MSKKKMIALLMSKGLKDSDINEIMEEQETEQKEEMELIKLLTVSCMVKEMFGKRNGTMFTITTAKTLIMGGRAFIIDDDSNNLSAVGVNHQVKVRAKRELSHDQYDKCDGPGHAARYPREWLLETLKEIFEI